MYSIPDSIACKMSDSVEIRHSPVAVYVARVERGLRFEQQNVRLFFGNRQVLDPSRNNHKLAFFKMDVAVSEPDEQMAFDHKKQLVFRFVMMPDEFALELHQLHLRFV